MKRDGTVSICVYYRQLNSITVSDPYYMITLEEIVDKVGNSTVLSTIDLAKGFYQIPIKPESRDKTAFLTPFGKFSFTRMPLV